MWSLNFIRIDFVVNIRNLTLDSNIYSELRLTNLKLKIKDDHLGKFKFY